MNFGLDFISRFSSPNYSEPNGGWKWVDDTPLVHDGNVFTSYQNWYPNNNQPDDQNSNQNVGRFIMFKQGSGMTTKNFSLHLLLWQLIKVLNSVTCNGGNDGQSYVTTDGGTAPYTYLWEDGQTTDTAFNLTAGEYIVTVTDDNGCTANDTATISEPALITGIDTQTACDTYTWIDGTTYTASNNTATHTLAAANGCDSVVSLDLTINYSPLFGLTSDTISKCNADSVLLDAGSGFNFYTWSNGTNSQQIYASQNGLYSVTVSDANGCSSTDSTFVDLLNYDIFIENPVICLGDSVG